MKHSLALAALLALTAIAGAQELIVGAPEEQAAFDADETIAVANAAYESGEFLVAVDGYQSLRDHGFDGGLLHYNLGNALLRAGQLGRAISAYRRAERRLPRNAEIEANLVFARLSSTDEIAPPEPGVVTRTVFFWHYGLSQGELWRLLIACNVVFWSLLTVRLLLRRRNEVLRWGLILLAVPLLASAGSLSIWRASSDSVAVILPPEVEVLSGTDRSSEVRFKLHAGSEVRLVEQLGDWIRITLPDGQQGWIESRHSEIVGL